MSWINKEMFQREFLDLDSIFECRCERGCITLDPPPGDFSSWCSLCIVCCCHISFSVKSLSGSNSISARWIRRQQGVQWEHLDGKLLQDLDQTQLRSLLKRPQWTNQDSLCFSWPWQPETLLKLSAWQKTGSASLDNISAWKVITALQFSLIHKCMRVTLMLKCNMYTRKVLTQAL